MRIPLLRQCPRVFPEESYRASDVADRALYRHMKRMAVMAKSPTIRAFAHARHKAQVSRIEANAAARAVVMRTGNRQVGT